MVNSHLELEFPFCPGKPIIARFNGGDITSDAGILLLAQADRKLGLCDALAAGIADVREPSKVTHTILDLVRTRLFAISMGYEDANDLDVLAHDPALKVANGRGLAAAERLASQPTMSRLENSVDSKDLLVMAKNLAVVVIRQLPTKTRTVILDVDASDDPCHGQQEFEFYDTHYHNHCYLPVFLHVTAEDGRQRLLAAELRPGTANSKIGLFGMLSRAVALLRNRFPKLKITLRGDGAYGQAEVIAFCEDECLPFILGIPTNKRIKSLAEPFEEKALAQAGDNKTTKRYYAQFTYQAGSWQNPQQVIERIEVTNATINPRFVVTNLPGMTKQQIYEFYCGRGEQENRIKELKLDLKCDRMSCHRFKANQFRLLLHAAASVLLCALQDCLTGTHFENAQMGTIRLKLLKVGAQAKESIRTLWFRLSSTFTEKDVWYTLHARLAVT
jgi:hypothetical protein